MDDAAKSQAEARTAQALAESPYEDFREPYRERLRWLKEARADAFHRALSSYETLVRNIAQGADPLEEWLEYGRQLGELSGAGEVYAVDETGRARTERVTGQLLLHLPHDQSVPALPLAVPKSLSEHQRATYDLLVRRKLTLE